MTEKSLCDFEDAILSLKSRHEALLKKTGEIDPEILEQYKADQHSVELMASIRTRFQQMKRTTQQVLYNPPRRKS